MCVARAQKHFKQAIVFWRRAFPPLGDIVGGLFGGLQLEGLWKFVFCAARDVLSAHLLFLPRFCFLWPRSQRARRTQTRSPTMRTPRSRASLTFGRTTRCAMA